MLIVLCKGTEKKGPVSEFSTDTVTRLLGEILYKYTENQSEYETDLSLAITKVFFFFFIKKIQKKPIILKANPFTYIKS